MSRVYNFDVHNGKIYLGRPSHVVAMSNLHNHCWNILTDPSLTDGEWIIAVNIILPHVAAQIAKLPAAQVANIIDTYVSTLTEDDSQVRYMATLGDTESKITHIIRERFEVMIKLGREVGSRDVAVEDSGLEDIKPFLAKIPIYPITSLAEVLNTYRARY